MLGWAFLVLPASALGTEMGQEEGRACNACFPRLLAFLLTLEGRCAQVTEALSRFRAQEQVSQRWGCREDVT